MNFFCVITTHQRAESKAKQAKSKFPRRESNPGLSGKRAESHILINHASYHGFLTLFIE